MTDPERPQTDPIVGRVNDLVTTFMDLLGALLLAAGAGWAVWHQWGLGWGLTIGGVAVTALSAWAQHRARPALPKQAARPRATLPGPSDPGNLHVAGR